MALGKQLPIRLDTDVEKRLESVASKNGTTKSALVRLLAKTFVEQVVRADGGISLPPNWASLLPGADGRSRASRGPVHRLNVTLNEEPSKEPCPPPINKGPYQLPPKKRTKKKP